MTLTPEQITAQSAWETEGVTRGIERYRKAALTADPTTLSPGQAFLKAVVKPLIGAIEIAQQEGLDALDGKGHVPGEWAMLIQLLPADKMAVIVASCMMRSGADEIGGKVLQLGRNIAQAIRLQVEHDRWTLEHGDRRDLDGLDAVARFKTRKGTMHRQQWSRWRKKLDTLILVEWDVGQEVALGGHLVGLAVACCPQVNPKDPESPRWFTQETQRVGIKTYLTVVLSGPARDLMKNLVARAEVSHPVRLPMIVPPVPWAYVDSTTPHSVTP